MEDNQVPCTAPLLTYLRAYHAAHDAPKIFDDFLAYNLLTEQERDFFDRQFATAVRIIDPEHAASCTDQETALAWFMMAIAPLSLAISRARYAEELLEKAVREGVRQYVILGAGMDTFAFRCPELVEQLQVYEVDHPATQACKRGRIDEVGWEQPAQLHFIPVDFSRENPAAALASSSYDPDAPSFFSWLGVTYYLDREAVSDTLRGIADVALPRQQDSFRLSGKRRICPRESCKARANRNGIPAKDGKADDNGLCVRPHLPRTWRVWVCVFGRI